VRWYRTRFDAEGLFDLERLGSAAPDRRERLRRAYRAFWKAALDGTPPERGGPSLPADAAAVRAIVPLAAAGTALARAVEAAARAGDLEAMAAAAERLEAHDAALVRHGTLEEAAAFLLQVFVFDKQNLAGDGVAEIAAATRRLHEELETRAALLADLLDPAAPAPVPYGGDHACVP
jgi:hypothetical protein